MIYYVKQEAFMFKGKNSFRGRKITQIKLLIQ